MGGMVAIKFQQCIRCGSLPIALRLNSVILYKQLEIKKLNFLFIQVTCKFHVYIILIYIFKEFTKLLFGTCPHNEHLIKYTSA